MREITPEDRKIIEEQYYVELYNKVLNDKNDEVFYNVLDIIADARRSEVQKTREQILEIIKD